MSEQEERRKKVDEIVRKLNKLFAGKVEFSHTLSPSSGMIVFEMKFLAVSDSEPIPSHGEDEKGTVIHERMMRCIDDVSCEVEDTQDKLKKLLAKLSSTIVKKHI